MIGPHQAAEGHEHLSSGLQSSGLTTKTRQDSSSGWKLTNWCRAEEPIGVSRQGLEQRLPFDSSTIDRPMRESTTRMTSREIPMPFQFLSGPMGPMSWRAEKKLQKTGAEEFAAALKRLRKSQQQNHHRCHVSCLSVCLSVWHLTSNREDSCLRSNANSA